MTPEVLLSFFDFPAEQWIHLKTSNPIESTFATVRLRTKVTKGGVRGGRTCHGVQADRGRQDRWRALNAPHLVALVRSGVKFDRGVMVERPTEQDTEVAA
jgi:putative transposase